MSSPQTWGTSSGGLRRPCPGARCTAKRTDGSECDGSGAARDSNLKKDLAGKVAREGGGWRDHVDEAAEA